MTTKTTLPWIKLPTNLLDDSVFNVQLSLEYQGIYAKLYLAAGKLDQRGSFIDHTGRELSTKEIAWMIHVDEKLLSKAMKVLLKAGMLSANGHGSFIAAFKSEQGESTHAERCEQWRQRQSKSRESRSSHDDVTRDTSARVKSQEEEEESRDKSQEGEQESSSSMSLRGPDQTDDDDLLSTSGRKNQIVRSIGIRKRERDWLLAIGNPITENDLLAELARNYERHFTDPERVKNPGALTGINLRRYEYPSAEWYDVKAWIRNIPGSILTAVRPDLVDQQDKALGVINKVTTRKKRREKSKYKSGELGRFVK